MGFSCSGIFPRSSSFLPETGLHLLTNFPATFFFDFISSLSPCPTKLIKSRWKNNVVGEFAPLWRYFRQPLSSPHEKDLPTLYLYFFNLSSAIKRKWSFWILFYRLLHLHRNRFEILKFNLLIIFLCVFLRNLVTGTMRRNKARRKRTICRS